MLTAAAPSGPAGESRVDEALGRYDDVAGALRRLSAITTVEQLFAVAPCELCRCGFARAWLTRIDDGGLRTVAAAGIVRAQGAGDDIRRLAFQTHEAEVIRRRRALLVARCDERVEPGIARRFGPRSYVVAPVVAQGRVLALLHADRPGAVTPLDELDRQTISVLTEGVGQSYQRILYQQQLASLRRHVRATQRLSSLLTPRELEVLRLIAGGETNAGIADTLVISQGTVKCHVRSVYRKLRAANRAEAVARYFTIAGQADA